MIVILLGIVFGFTFVIFSQMSTRKHFQTLLGVIGAVCFLVGILVGIFKPVRYSNQEFYKQIDIVSFNFENDEEKDVFIKYSNSKDEYTYRYAITHTFQDDTSTVYLTKHLSKLIDGTIEVIESTDCTIPRIDVYVEKGERTIWTYGILSNRYYYYIYIPKGSLLEEK